MAFTLIRKIVLQKHDKNNQKHNIMEILYLFKTFLIETS